MDEYHWAGISKEFVKQNPSQALNLIDKVLENFDSSFFGHYNSQAQEILDEISHSDPIKTWEIVSKHIKIPMDQKTFYIRGWLRDSKFLLTVPFVEINKWIKTDIKNHAWFISYSSPLTLENNQNNLLRELLIHYGERDDVRKNIIANLDTEMISGSTAMYYTTKKKIFEKFRESETHPNIINWADWYISILEKEIRREKDREEREF